jgi:hypothetical protein
LPDTSSPERQPTLNRNNWIPFSPPWKNSRLKNARAAKAEGLPALPLGGETRVFVLQFN